MSSEHITANNTDQLATSFIPTILRREYRNNPDRNFGDPLKEDHATLLWIDVCNFSPLCNRLMKDSVSGVEKITGILQNHYDSLLKHITEYGGQPLFFAGDGLMSAWPGDQKKAEESVQIAAACARNIIDNRTTIGDNNELLSLHAIISQGPWQMTELEGIDGNRLASFFGDVFSDFSLASKNKAPNQLLITNTALSFLDPELRSEPIEHETSILHDSPSLSKMDGANLPPLSERAWEHLKLFLPRTLTFPLKAEHLKWIAEIRPVTIVFVRLPNDSRNSSENLAQLRGSVELARPLVTKYEGLMNQVWMDEKESNMLICFGPPPSAHIDNSERSVRLGYEIHHLLRKSGIENSVGVCTGMAYCGILGNDNLRQYTVIGDVVNLSAHMAGIKKNEIFCDKATYSVSNKTVNYGGQVMAAVKGRKEPISLFVPKSLLDDNLTKSNLFVSIGRKKELAELTEAFQEVSQGKTECIIVEGNNGMGKTRLLGDFANSISSQPVRIAEGTGDVVLINTPYAAFRSIVSTLLGINQAESEKNQVEINEGLMSRFGNQASLLNIVFNTAVPDSSEVQGLTASQRVQATHDLLLKIISEEASKQPLVLIIDDARWADQSTWELIESIKKSVVTCLIILSFQNTEGLPEVQRLKNIGAKTLVLKELADKDLEALICAKLGVGSISKDVSEVVLKIANGNPFFCIELAGSLVDHELLLFQNNSCSLVPDKSTKELALPETIRGAIRRRIDKLGQGSQLSLKVGSVIGNRFAEKIICNIYPIATERESVPSYLNEVEKYGFLNETTVDNLNGYLFNNATTADVAYEMTLAEQRRQLHRESALWYEKNFEDNLAPFFVRLSNHWLEAGEKKTAALYLEKEAIHLFKLGFVKQALDVGLEGVKLLDYHIEREPAAIGPKIGEHMGMIGGLMADKTIEGLVDHNKLEDQNTEIIIKMLLELAPFAFQSQQGELFALMGLGCLRLTLEQGNGESAAEVYSMYAILYKVLTNDSVGAFTWSKLALAVDEKNSHSLFSRVFFIHGWFIAHWMTPIKELIPFSRKAADAGLATDDIVFGCFNLSLEVILKSTAGSPLAEVIETATKNFTRNNQRVMNAVFHLKHEEQVAKALMGSTTAYTSLSDEKYDEGRDIASICATDLYNQIGYYLVSKLKLNVHFGNWKEGLEWGEKSLPLLPAFANQPGQFEKDQYYAIAALYHSFETDGETAAACLSAANTCIDNMYAWSKFCPDNFLHKALLLDAIRKSIAGATEEAEKLFEQSALHASEAGFIQDAGLAYEHLMRMKKRNGANHEPSLESAVEAYQKWGAAGKIKYLLEEFGVPVARQLA